MKVCGLPPECPWIKPDYSVKGFDWDGEMKRESEHSERLATWIRKSNWNGPYSGGIVSFGVADGSALYMLADGKHSYLFHLPYGDGYQYRDIKFLPKTEIVRRLKQQDHLKKIFNKEKA